MLATPAPKPSSRAGATRAALLAIAVLLAAVGCTPKLLKPKSKKPPPKPCKTLPLSLHLKVHKLINLNPAGQPQSLEVRLLLLRERETFDALDFRTVWREAKKELKEALVRQISLTVFPGTDKLSTYESPLDVRYVVVMGLFRKPDGDDWKYVADIRAKAKDCVEGALRIPVTAQIRESKISRFVPNQD